jgi:hypothetical protein
LATERGGRAGTPAASAAPLSSRWPILLSALTLLIHLATNTGYDFFRDEFYYIACGRHLAWGYVDQPPLVAVLVDLGRGLFGPSLAGLRFLPALAGALTVLLAGLMARDLGGGGFAQALAGLCVMVAPVYLEGFTLFTMNAFDFLLWTILCWLLIRILRNGKPRAWLLFGLVAGIGLLNKTSLLFLIGGLFLGLLLTAQRRQLARPWPWVAATLALAIFAPHLMWQARHGWPTLEFMHNAQVEKNVHASPLAFLAGQVLIHHPLTAPVWLAGLAFLLVAKREAALRPLGVAYLAIFGLFVMTGAKLYYLSPIYPVLFAAGAVVMESASAGPRGRWLRAPALGLLLAGGALTAPAVLPVLPPEQLEAYLKALHLKPPLMEHHRPPRLTQTFADEFGWEDMVRKVAAAFHALPPADQARCAIYAHNYGEAGALDFYGPKYGLPPAASGHNSYWTWGPPRDRGAVVITVGESEDDVHKTYRDATVVDRTRNDWCMPYEDDVPIIVGRDPISTFEEIWPRCKIYI